MDGKSWVRYLRIDWSHVEIGVITKEIEQFQNDVPKENEIDRSIYLDRPIDLISKKFQNVFEQVEGDRPIDLFRSTDRSYEDGISECAKYLHG